MAQNMQHVKGAYHSKPKRDVQEDRKDRMKISVDGSKEKVDIGTFHDIIGKNVIFVTNNGIKFLMDINKFATLKDVNPEVISALQNSTK